MNHFAALVAVLPVTVSIGVAQLSTPPLAGEASATVLAGTHTMPDTSIGKHFADSAWVALVLVDPNRRLWSSHPIDERETNAAVARLENEARTSGERQLSFYIRKYQQAAHRYGTQDCLSQLVAVNRTRVMPPALVSCDGMTTQQAK